MFCVVVELTNGKNVTRTVRRRKNYERNERQVKSSPESFDDMALSLQNKLEKVERFNERIVNVLAVLDGKIDKINDKFLKISKDENPSINEQLVLLERRINDIDHKINTLINQSEKCLDDEKKFKARGEEPLLLKITENLNPINLESMIKEIKDSLELFEDKVQHNLSENGKKIDHIETFIFENYLHKNFSEDEFSMQIQRNQRKERRIVGKKNLINEILTMVKRKLNTDDGAELKNLTDTVSSLTDMFSSSENTKPSLVVGSEQKNKTSPNTMSRGIIFPNVKNKPAKLNTAFMSEAFGNRDIRVSYFISILRNLEQFKFTSTFVYSGVFMHRADERRHATIKCILSPDPRHNLLVFESFL